MGIFKRLTTPSIPNIGKTEQGVDWFFRHDDSLEESIKSVPEPHRTNLRTTIISVIEECRCAGDIQEHIDEAFQTNQSSTQMMHQFHAAKEEGFDTNTEANAAVEAATKAFVLEACSSVMLRLYGYFMIKKYGVEPIASNTSANSETRYEAMLRAESTNEEIAAILKKVRREGATEDDIRNWRNMSEDEKAVVYQQDDTARMALYLQCVDERNMTPDEAADQVWKYHPIYGDPDDMWVCRGPHGRLWVCRAGGCLLRQRMRTGTRVIRALRSRRGIAIGEIISGKRRKRPRRLSPSACFCRGIWPWSPGGRGRCTIGHLVRERQKYNEDCDCFVWAGDQQF